MPISIRVIFFAGSRFDEIPGTAHFLEHMLVSGSRKFPTKNKLSAYVESTGGSIGASTDNYSIKLDLIIPKKDDLKIGLEALKESLFYPLFEQTTIELERSAILTEIEKRRQNPQVHLWDMYRELFFQKTTSAHSVVGDKISVSKITKKDLLDFKDKFIRPERMCIIMSGDIDPNEAESYLNEYLPYEKVNGILDELPLLPSTYDTKILAENFNDNKQNYITIGFRTCSSKDKDSAVLEIIASIMGNGRSSRLVNELRYKNGLIYDVSCSNNYLPDTGTLTVSTSCSETNIEKVIEIIIGEFEKIKNEPINSSELESSKSKLIKSQYIKMQTSQSWVQVHDKELLFNTNKPKLITDYINEIESVDVSDISSVAKKYFNKNQILLAMYGFDKKPAI